MDVKRCFDNAEASALAPSPGAASGSLNKTIDVFKPVASQDLAPLHAPESPIREGKGPQHCPQCFLGACGSRKQIVTQRRQPTTTRTRAHGDPKAALQGVSVQAVAYPSLHLHQVMYVVGRGRSCCVQGKYICCTQYAGLVPKGEEIVQ